MRLLLLCVISVFLSSKSFAQFNVYLKPVISQKFMSSIGGFPQKNITGVSPIPSPYLHHNHLNFMSVGGFDVGFDAGIQLKKHFLSFNTCTQLLVEDIVRVIFRSHFTLITML